MGIDKFINDYLDGTLTPQDDKKFRDLLENDVEAQEELDLMLSIHSILKEDAESITLPKQLEEKVEQRLLATYLKIVAVNAQQKDRRPVYALLLFVIFFLLSVFKIDDGKLLQYNSFFVSEILKQQNLLENQLNILEEEKNISKADFSKSEVKSNIAYDIKPNIIESSIPTIEKYSIVDNTFPPKLEAISEGRLQSQKIVSLNDNQHRQFSVKLFSNSSLYPEFLGQNLSLKLLQSQNDNTYIFAKDFTTQGIALTGFSSLPVKKFGYNKGNLKSFSSFSQSLGYRIGKNFRLGLEFGHFNFDYVQNTTILVPAIQSSAPERKIYSKSTGRKDFDAKILQNGEDFSYPRYVKVIVPIEKKYQQYWGSLFVDYVYAFTNYISFVSRINIGATSEGFLGGVRIYTEFQPIDGIAFNIGVENKSYLSTVPIEPSSLKSIFSIVYGLSIKLNFNE